MQRSFVGLIVTLALLAPVACETAPKAGATGDRWERVFFTPSSARALLFAGDVAVYATDRGLFTSSDSEHFRRPEADIPGRPEVVALAAAPNLRDIYAVTDVGYLLRSKDRGGSFAMIGQFPNTRVTGIALTRGERLFVSSSSGILVSTQDLTGVPAKRARAYIMPWETLVLGLPIWRRANLGSDTDLWKDWTVSLAGNALWIAADPDDADHLIAELFRKGAYQTRDEGMTWSPIVAEEGAGVRGPIAFGPGGTILIGRFLSRDGGRSFRATRLEPDASDMMQAHDPEFAAHSVAATDSGLFAVQYRAGKIYASSDGQQWRRIGTASDFMGKEKETGPAVLAVDSAGRLWVAVDRHGLFRHVEK